MRTTPSSTEVATTEKGVGAIVVVVVVVVVGVGVNTYGILSPLLYHTGGDDPGIPVKYRFADVSNHPLLCPENVSLLSVEPVPKIALPPLRMVPVE